MVTLESGQNKIKEITERLRKDTLEPAKAEAMRLGKEAEARAAHLVAEGERRAKELEVRAKAAIEKERSVHETALKQAGRQAVEALKQEIEGELFDAQLGRRVTEASSRTDVVVAVINTLVKAVEILLQKSPCPLDLLLKEAVDDLTMMTQQVGLLVAAGDLQHILGEPRLLRQSLREGHR